MNVSCVHSKDKTGCNISFSISSLLIGLLLGTLLSQPWSADNNPMNMLRFNNNNNNNSSTGGSAVLHLHGDDAETTNKLRGGRAKEDSAPYDNDGSFNGEKSNGEESSSWTRMYSSLLDRENSNVHRKLHENTGEGEVDENDDSEYYEFEYETYYDEHGRRRLKKKRRRRRNRNKKATPAPVPLPTMSPTSAATPVPTVTPVDDNNAANIALATFGGLMMPSEFPEQVDGFDVARFNTFVSMHNSDPDMSMENKILDCIDEFAPDAVELLSKLPPLVGPGFFLNPPGLASTSGGKGKGGKGGKGDSRRKKQRKLKSSDGKGKGGKGGKGKGNDGVAGPEGAATVDMLDFSSPQVVSSVLNAQAMTNMCYQVFAPPVRCSFVFLTASV